MIIIDSYPAVEEKQTRGQERTVFNLRDSSKGYKITKNPLSLRYLNAYSNEKK
jgi:hypothetical protein